MGRPLHSVALLRLAGRNISNCPSVELSRIFMRNNPGTRIDQAFLQRFPSLAGLVEGIALRMKTLAPVHLRALWRLADHLYGQEAFLRAARRAQD